MGPPREPDNMIMYEDYTWVPVHFINANRSTLSRWTSEPGLKHLDSRCPKRANNYDCNLFRHQSLQSNIPEGIAHLKIECEHIEFHLYPGEGFPHGIFHPCRLWHGGSGQMENCWCVVAVSIIWKFRSTVRSGNYVWRVSYYFGLLDRGLGE